MRKHLAARSQKPVADHTQSAFSSMLDWLGGHNTPVILDACCGVGDSSRHLADRFPDHLVIGVDKSSSRLGRERSGDDPTNLFLLRADLNDFYRLAVDAELQFERHYILYPNPWPKAAHLGRRWHGAPAFADIVKLKGRLELRSNWHLYLEEFRLALAIAGFSGEIAPFTPDTPLTPFEAKYHASGHELWRLVADLSGC